MKTKPILPCPAAMLRAGIHQMLDAAILVHLGRCGLSCATMNDLIDATGGNRETVRTAVERLMDLHLVVRASRSNGAGRAFAYCVSVRGWGLLTAPADFSMFQQPVSA